MMSDDWLVCTPRLFETIQTLAVDQTALPIQEQARQQQLIGELITYGRGKDQWCKGEQETRTSIKSVQKVQV
jgi:hypothetical protein